MTGMLLGRRPSPPLEDVVAAVSLADSVAVVVVAPFGSKSESTPVGNKPATPAPPVLLEALEVPELEAVLEATELELVASGQLPITLIGLRRSPRRPPPERLLDAPQIRSLATGVWFGLSRSALVKLVSRPATP